jgi:hypothetical protein
MNAQALKHEGTMVEVYSKMKPDTFTSQLQTVLTAYYKDIPPFSLPSSLPPSLPPQMGLWGCTRVLTLDFSQVQLAAQVPHSAHRFGELDLHPTQGTILDAHILSRFAEERPLSLHSTENKAPRLQKGQRADFGTVARTSQFQIGLQETFTKNVSK